MPWTATIKPLDTTPNGLVNGNFNVDVDYKSDDNREVGRSYLVNVNNFSDSNYVANLVQNELNNLEAYDNIVSSVNAISAKSIDAQDPTDVPVVADESLTPVELSQIDAPSQVVPESV